MPKSYLGKPNRQARGKEVEPYGIRIFPCISFVLEEAEVLIESTLMPFIPKPLLLALICSACATFNLFGKSVVLPATGLPWSGILMPTSWRIHGYLETFLLQRTQEEPVSIRNLGWGGDVLTARDRPTNFPSEESTLTNHKTDLIIACFGMGNPSMAPKEFRILRKTSRPSSHPTKERNTTDNPKSAWP